MKKIVAIIFAATLFLLGSMVWAADIGITMTITPSAIAPGNDGFISLTITNSGTSSVDARIDSLTVNSPIVLDPYSSDLGKIDKASSTSSLIKFRVPPSTASGFYAASMKINICEGSICTSYTKDAIITVQSPSYIAIESLTPTTFQSGEKQTMKLTITNGGGTTVNNVRISWTDASNRIFPYGTGNTIFIPSIGEHLKQTAETDIVVSPGATQGVYPLTFTIMYDDQTGAQQTATYVVGIKVEGRYNFVVSTDEQSALVPGKTGDFTVKIANGGSQDAQYMIASIEKDGIIKDVNPELAYIGIIESDDFDTQNFIVEIGQVSPGIYPINVNLEYQDVYGQSYNGTYAIKIRVISASEAENSQDNYTWLLVIVVIAAVAYLWFRRRKKKK